MARKRKKASGKASRVKIILIFGVISFFALTGLFISCGKQAQEMISPAALMVTAPTVEWVKQFGTSSYDYSYGVYADDSGVYVTGNLLGTLPGQRSKGGYDGYVIKFDDQGKQVWAKQFGTSKNDYPRAIHVSDTGIFVTGYTYGNFGGSAGSIDVFVTCFTQSGSQRWIEQFGTNSEDYGNAVFSDDTGVYIVGRTYGNLPNSPDLGAGDAFIKKYSVNGQELWTDQFGSAMHDFCRGVFADPSGVYVAGYTYGGLPGQKMYGGGDAYVRKYDKNGNHIWTNQYGSNRGDAALDVIADPSGVYVGGYTMGKMPGQRYLGNWDGFVARFDNNNGTMNWLRQFGTSSLDQVMGVTRDKTGVYVGGSTQGALSGQASSGHLENVMSGKAASTNSDAFVRKYDDGGNLLWTKQFGTSDNDYGNDVSANSAGVFLAGYTNGTFPNNTKLGNWDAFLAKVVSSAPQDTTPPAVGASPKSRDWSPDAVSVILTVSDDSSGIKSSQYVWSGGTNAPASGWNNFKNGDMITQKKDGIWFLHLRAEDKEGNKVQTYSGAFKIDTQPPVIGINSPNTTGLYFDTDTIPLDLSITDALSGVAKQTVLLNGRDVTGQKTLGPLAPGKYLLEVSAADLAGNSVSTRINFSVILKALINFDPDTLNLTSMGNWVTVYIEFPPQYSVADIDLSSVSLNNIIMAELSPSAPGMVKFDRAAVQNILLVGDKVKVTVRGSFAGKSFEGFDVIRVIDEGVRYKAGDLPKFPPPPGRKKKK